MQAWAALLTLIGTIGTVGVMCMLSMQNRIHKQADERQRQSDEQVNKVEERVNVIEIEIKDMPKCYMSKELCNQFSGNCKAAFDQQFDRDVNTFNDIRDDIKELGAATKSEIKELSGDIKTLRIDVVKLGEHLPR